MDDPLSLFYSRVWQLVNDSKLPVLIGNQINYGEYHTDPRKIVSLQGDAVQLELTPSEFTFEPDRTSNSAFLTQTYTWTLASNDFLLTKSFYPVLFALVAMHRKWCLELTQLEWEGVKYVNQVNTIEGITGLNAEANQSGAQPRILGWVSQSTFDVEFKFSREMINTFIGELT